MDDLILPNRPKKQGGVREIVDILPGKAPQVRLDSGDLVVIGDVGLSFAEPGTYIILPLGVWAGMVRKAVQNEQVALDAARDATDVIAMTRQVRRAIKRDRNN